MAQQSLSTKAIKFIAKDLVLDFLYWPVWWYTRGAILAFRRMVDTITNGSRSVALMVWVKNIFVPMYGDYTWQGRLISVLMRVAQIFGRFIIFIGWIIFAFVVFVLWFVLPLFVVFQLIFNLVY
ncbi:hypothetical protein COT97_05915 [Candidatus Falkowbacteria bacterium CG10_big_fil_rev_8_21_14_0_10_39_11]|uniref:Uncharacterized protein n=1 Tax=Candidatus Falkowbacteria bacterium CG10_big_fil_rev_8_21_14_0_10_39_11 TaxID=1974565 RepID=A0A2H0V3B1_9BACT|nr:MAG: hypothetical protein COT97_05915 [Candidatus Falkowbacteria bacterium CG10_big_fil_rev_8_21_14_0_10_39_11]